ncbi:hypothetical protein PR003_g8203 [Phytophthora rubi]|uniref:Secreted protein n=1 Tax=Phytophthora rubi TaxID=129364 RepID=A0A6A4FK57_9STRA|nr:hypothetical protein PR002_g7936 [Phytophthora rubi]KAE9039212.1 hypothetical protein PR001_g7605 [Phytophthora rubi]KAE9344927.1 hypothetical protein PR003_g8203 [Phytophthora rubi]
MGTPIRASLRLLTGLTDCITGGALVAFGSVGNCCCCCCCWKPRERLASSLVWLKRDANLSLAGS